MMVLSEFYIPGIQFNVVHLETRNRVQLWMRFKGQQWEIGHGKDVPAGMTPQVAAHYMREFIMGYLSLDQYNELVP